MTHIDCGWTRGGLADLSLTPLLPVPWPLQLRKDREAIKSGIYNTKPRTQCCHFITSPWWADPSQLKGQAVMWEPIWRWSSAQWHPQHVMHTHIHTESYPSLNLISSTFTKTVITLGFSCWLSENPLSTELGRQSSDGCHTYIHMWHACECVHTHTFAGLKIGLCQSIWNLIYTATGLKIYFTDTWY